MSKIYYWLKLNKNFFEREEIKIIENMPNGKDYIIFYLKLLLKSISTEGKLKFRNIIPYTPEMLSAITGTDIDTVRVAIDLFTKLDLMEIWDDGTLFMIETQNMIGSETDSAKRVRKHRQKKALESEENKEMLQSNTDVTECNDEVIKSNTDIEIDTDKDIDKDKDTVIKKPVTAPHEEIVNLYHSICISFNPIKRITDKRKGSMNARYRENDNDIEVFRTVFTKVQNSTFLKGGWNTGGKADFDWILRPTNFVKILEGKYDDKDKPKQNKNLSKLEQMYQEALAEEEGGLI